MSKAEQRTIAAARDLLNRSTELLRQSMRQGVIWQERCNELEQARRSLQQERDGFAQQARELREQLSRVAAVRVLDGEDARAPLKQRDYGDLIARGVEAAAKMPAAKKRRKRKHDT